MCVVVWVACNTVWVSEWGGDEGRGRREKIGRVERSGGEVVWKIVLPDKAFFNKRPRCTQIFHNLAHPSLPSLSGTFFLCATTGIISVPAVRLMETIRRMGVGAFSLTLEEVVLLWKRFRVSNFFRFGSKPFCSAKENRQILFKNIVSSEMIFSWLCLVSKRKGYVYNLCINLTAHSQQ